MPSNSLSDKFLIRPSTLEDIPAIFTCAEAAFKNDNLNLHLFPKEKAHLTTREEFCEYRINSMRKRFELPGKVACVVVPIDKPEIVAASSVWIKPNPKKDPLEPPPEEALPASMEPSVREEFLKNLKAMRQEVWGEDGNFWHLVSLAVSPDYQRQGIATWLMKQQLEQIDKDGLPCYLESTEAGAKFYPTLGFECKAQFEMLGGKIVNKGMVRAPRESAVKA